MNFLLKKKETFVLNDSYQITPSGRLLQYTRRAWTRRRGGGTCVDGMCVFERNERPAKRMFIVAYETRGERTVECRRRRYLTKGSSDTRVILKLCHVGSIRMESARAVALFFFLKRRKTDLLYKNLSFMLSTQPYHDPSTRSHPERGS